MNVNKWLKKTLSVTLALTMAFGFVPGLARQEAAAAANGITQAYEEVFAGDRIIDIHVTVSDEDWASILSSPLDKEYKTATVEIDGQTIENVGFSTKGNLTLRSVAAMSDSDRYSFRLKFDKYDKEQTWLGLDKLSLNNGFSDPSYLREYLHYEALREIGMDAPLTVFANLYINGELFGFYTGVESVDDSYLARTVGEDYSTGVLYDTDAGSTLQYVEGSDYDTITRDLGIKDNKASLKNFIKVLNDMPDGEKGDIEEVLDVDSALKYIAANFVFGNYDSYNGDKAQNYMLYGDAAGKYTVIPWDFNMSFNGYTPMSGSNTTAVAALLDEPVLGISMEDAPMINNLLKVAEYKERYLDYVNQLVDYLENIEDRVGELADLIRPYVEADPTKFYTMEQFEANVSYSSDNNAGGGNGGVMPGDGTEPGRTPGEAPPDGTIPDGAAPGATPPEGVEPGSMTPPDGSPPGGQGPAPGGNGGVMASNSLLTFALNRLVNLQEQLGRDLSALPEPSGSEESPASGSDSTDSTGTDSTGTESSGETTTSPTTTTIYYPSAPVAATESDTETATTVDSTSAGSTTSTTAAGTTATTTTTATNTTTAVAEPSASASSNSGEIKIMMNGSIISFSDQQPIMDNGRVLAPVYGIARALGAKLQWDETRQQVTLTAGETTVVLTIGSNTAYVNGKATQLDVAAKTVQYRTVVPVRFLAESLGLQLKWLQSTTTVQLAS